RAWFEAVMRPRLAPGGLVEFVGKLTAPEREELLAGALALISVPERPDPFPYVALEALACGTPVIAARRGAYAELVADGHIGFLVDTATDLQRAVERAADLDRSACRKE